MNTDQPTLPPTPPKLPLSDVNAVLDGYVAMIADAHQRFNGFTRRVYDMPHYSHPFKFLKRAIAASLMAPVLAKAPGAGKQNFNAYLTACVAQELDFPFAAVSKQTLEIAKSGSGATSLSDLGGFSVGYFILPPNTLGDGVNDVSVVSGCIMDEATASKVLMVEPGDFKPSILLNCLGMIGEATGTSWSAVVPVNAADGSFSVEKEPFATVIGLMSICGARALGGSKTKNISGGKESWVPSIL